MHDIVSTQKLTSILRQQWTSKDARSSLFADSADNGMPTAPSRKTV